jgi:hypothetical protein
MVDIDQFQLHDLFADPSGLYEQMVNRRGYEPKQVVEFDAELITPGWSAMGHVLIITMAHRERLAHVIMLSSEDLSALRETLSRLQISLNTAGLLSTGHPVFGNLR